MSAGGRPPEEIEALAALRARQGRGARYDSAGAPAEALVLARRGTAYFARRLNELDDAALDGDSLFVGVGRRLLVSGISYQARALARIAEAARNGRSEEIFGDPDQEPDDSILGASLPPHALRYLFSHAETHLNVEWRDLNDAGWDRTILAMDGRRVTPRASVREHAAALWLGAVALGNGGALRDVPAEIRPQTLRLESLGGAIAGEPASARQ